MYGSNLGQNLSARVLCLVTSVTLVNLSSDVGGQTPRVFLLSIHYSTQNLLPP